MGAALPRGRQGTVKPTGVKHRGSTYSVPNMNKMSLAVMFIVLLHVCQSVVFGAVADAHENNPEKIFKRSPEITSPDRWMSSLKRTFCLIRPSTFPAQHETPQNVQPKCKHVLYMLSGYSVITSACSIPLPDRWQD